MGSNDYFYDQPSSIDRMQIRQARLRSEKVCIAELLELFSDEYQSPDQDLALAVSEMVTTIQSKQAKGFNVERLWVEYDLSGDAGANLLCLAEALLRIPDVDTRRRFIKDRIQALELSNGEMPSWFAEFSSFGLGLSKRLFSNLSGGWLSNISTSMLDKVVMNFVSYMAQYFILAETFPLALKQAVKSQQSHGYGFSFDMLGEVAYTEADAARYYGAYKEALLMLVNEPSNLNKDGSGISIKLSAITTRFEFSKRSVVVPVLVEKVLELCLIAKQASLILIMDAEEADCLELALDVLEQVYQSPDIGDFDGLGIAIQAYQKRASSVIDWLAKLASKHQKRLPCRLVKGAYWDTEIKHAQMHGLDDYDVFTRKSTTDLNYLACVKSLKLNIEHIYPQIATHNAHTVLAVRSIMGDEKRYEYQRLFGMGASLFEAIMERYPDIKCSIYAPVGSHADLLPYLARRMLENGANTSFVHQVAQGDVSIEHLSKHPVHRVGQYQSYHHPNIPLPRNLYLPRLNSKGYNLNDFPTIEAMIHETDAYVSLSPQTYTSLVDFKLAATQESITITNPSKRTSVIGYVHFSSQVDAQKAIDVANIAYKDWSQRPLVQRSDLLRQTADLVEDQVYQLCWWLISEAGKTWADAVDEVRETVDFLRYYADQADLILKPELLPGPTGECNTLYRCGRGVFVCISPWNFPLAIFTGQIAAALVAGNAVIAKPARQTPLIAIKMVELFYQAGVPKSVLQLLIGSVGSMGRYLLAHDAIDGVMVTGSTQTAQVINRQLAERKGSIIPLIAETGGQNAMIVDSTALLEQVTTDIIDSAFRSCGQRCSALRVLFVQEEIAESLLTMLAGAMQQLTVGDPSRFDTDVGPVIDAVQCRVLEDHVQYLSQVGQLIAQVPTISQDVDGSFFLPLAYEIPSISLLKQEIFGPILHVVRYKHQALDDVCNEINALGYGLTFGVHTRIVETYERLSKQIQVGNVYINRNIIGAQVGVQPFGGQGMSGTGPKAGGPFYLTRLCQEKTVSNNTAAMGGNASLMALED